MSTVYCIYVVSYFVCHLFDDSYFRTLRMSLTNQPVKRTPRAMPVETIITRFKSAQQKKLQEPKQKKVKKSTTRKNKTYSKTSILHPKTEKEHPIEELTKTKKQIIENNEFYPDRQKRNIVPKKIVLMPKHCLKMIGGTKSKNKRKLHIPRKEITPARNIFNDNSQTKNEMDLNLIKVTKQSSSKTSKEVNLPDLVRIIEESGSLDEEDFLEILTCPSPVWWEDPPHGYIEEAIYTRQPVEQSNRSQSSEQTQVKLSNKLDSFNLVNNLVLNVENKGKNFIKKRGKLETLLNNMRDKINNTEVTDLRNTFTNVVANNRNVNIFKNEFNHKREKKNSDSFDEDQLSDLRDDEVLRHLENIDIPIENNSNELNQEDIKLSKDTTDYDSDKNMSIVEEYLDMSYFEDDDIKDKSDISMGLKIYDSNDLPLEKTFKKYQKVSKSIKESNTVKEINEPNTEYVAIYKIIESDDEDRKPEMHNDLKNRYINTYYKHKKFKSNHEKSKCVCKLKNKSIKVSETESVKYCLICSSIYDTDDCKYCLRKLNGNCKCKSKYTCDFCNLRMGTKNEMIRHLKDHDKTLISRK